jgi:hypothetical protein
VRSSSLHIVRRRSRGSLPRLPLERHREFIILEVPSNIDRGAAFHQ